VTEKSVVRKEIDMARNSPGISCHRVLVSYLNLRVFIAIRKWETCSRSVIIDATLVITKVNGETIDGAPKTRSKLAKNM
jgi:hypothetical protein